MKFTKKKKSFVSFLKNEEPPFKNAKMYGTFFRNLDICHSICPGKRILVTSMSYFPYCLRNLFI